MRCHRFRDRCPRCSLMTIRSTLRAHRDRIPRRRYRLHREAGANPMDVLSNPDKFSFEIREGLTTDAWDLFLFNKEDADAEIRWVVVHAITLLLTLTTYLFPRSTQWLLNPDRSASNSPPVSATRHGRRTLTDCRRARFHPALSRRPARFGDVGPLHKLTIGYIQKP